MPTLSDTLRGRDLGFLKMVANAWGLELNAPDAATGLPQLVSGILEHQWRDEVLESLPQPAQDALQTLQKNEGRLSWAVFIRRYGEVRPYGPGKREKERPDLKPTSAAETLWYRALIGRAILNLPGENPPIEYAYIPDDLLDFLILLKEEETPPGRPASPSECAQAMPVNDRILDHACTLLAALRLGLPISNLSNRSWDIPPQVLLELLKAARMVDETGQPLAEPTRAFLEKNRAQGLAELAHSWLNALYLNELRLLPGLKFEGDWVNDSLRARQTIFKWLGQVPQGIWWSLTSFVRAIREMDPDFQRPAGDYDSWFIRQESSGAFLRGFTSWDEVDGALVRFLVTGPFHWLGILDLAAAEPGGEPSAFRFSAWAEDLINHHPPAGLPAETASLRLTSGGKIHVPRLAPRALRYQVARFCQWEDETAEEYRYKVTPAALERAAQQGLRPRQFIALLRRQTEGGQVPPVLAQALERWETLGTQARVEPGVLLRVKSPEVLAVLKKSRAWRYILEELDSTTALIHPGAEDKVIEALSELGYMAEHKP